MASLKDMRNQISSVKATQKITKAMQMVAAAKLRRRDHLHRLRDLLRGFHARDPIAHILDAGHRRLLAP